MAQIEAVNVYLRIRPCKSEEQSTKQNVVEVLNDREVQLKHQHSKRFSFHKVFTPKSNQAVIYQNVVAPLVEKVLNGYTCTLLVYGQSGTGKTYTLFGNVSDPTKYGKGDSDDGCIPRALTNVFNEMTKMDKNVERTVRVSCVELFNEELVDLLHDNSEPQLPLRVQEDPEQRGNMYIQNLSAHTVCDAADVKRMFEIAEENRINSSLLENAENRSHKIFIVNVYTRIVTLPGEERMKSGKLLFIDVAGCENLKRNGKVSRKGTSLNQSLVTLTNVIRGLEERNSYIPYGESKLTRILRESFGGRSKTAVIATISPMRSDADDTLNTLNFARGTKTIKNTVEMNKITTKSNIVNCLHDELHRLEKDLIALRRGTGFYVNAQNYNSVIEQSKEKEKEVKEKMMQIAEMEDKIKHLELTKLYREEQWDSLTKSFELTKSKALLHKKRLLKRRVQAENVKDIVEVTQTVSQPVLEQHEELKALLEKSTKHSEILQNKTNVAQEKLKHNTLLKQDLCRTLVKLCSNMVQNVEDEKDELAEWLTNVCANIKNTVTLMKDESHETAEKTKTLVADLQSALKPDAVSSMKIELENNIHAFNAIKQDCFTFMDQNTVRLEGQRMLLQDILQENAEKYETFNREQLNAASVLRSVNEEFVASSEIQSRFLTQASEMTEEFLKNISTEDQMKLKKTACVKLEENLRELFKIHDEEETTKSEAYTFIANAHSQVNDRLKEINADATVYDDFSKNIDDCVKMVEKENENTSLSIFENDFDSNVFKQKMSGFEKLLQEDVDSLGSCDRKADIVTDLTERLHNFCQSDMEISAELEQKLTAKIGEFDDYRNKVQASKQNMYTEITDALKTLTENVNGLCEEQFVADDSVLSSIENIDPSAYLNEDSGFSKRIGELLGMLKRLHNRFD